MYICFYEYIQIHHKHHTVCVARTHIHDTHAKIAKSIILNQFLIYFAYCDKFKSCLFYGDNLVQKDDI